MLIVKILGETGTIHWNINTYRDETFNVVKYNEDTEVSTAFSLTDYDGTFKIFDFEGGTELYSKATTLGTEFTFSSNTFRIKDKINIPAAGKYYFEIRISHKTDALIDYKLWFGEFDNAK